MSFYPKIATITYASKHLNVTIPIRAKLVPIEKYRCTNKDCHIWNRGFTQKDLWRFLWAHNEELKHRLSKGNAPRNKQGKLLCPCCLINQKERPLTYFKKHLIKLTVVAAPTYVNLVHLLNDATNHRWKESDVLIKKEIVCYKDTIKDAKKGFSHTHTNPKTPNPITITMHHVTKKQLQEAHDKYKGRRIAKLI